MNFRNAAAAGLSLNITATSPPVTTGASPLPMGGNENTLASVPTFALVSPVMAAPTKSPSISIAAFGGLLNMFCTDSGNSVCSVSLVPPGSQSDFTMLAIVVSAVLDRRVRPRDLDARSAGRTCPAPACAR